MSLGYWASDEICKGKEDCSGLPPVDPPAPELQLGKKSKLRSNIRAVKADLRMSELCSQLNFKLINLFIFFPYLKLGEIKPSQDDRRCLWGLNQARLLKFVFLKQHLLLIHVFFQIFSLK